MKPLWERDSFLGDLVNTLAVRPVHRNTWGRREGAVCPPPYDWQDDPDMSDQP